MRRRRKSPSRTPSQLVDPSHADAARLHRIITVPSLLHARPECRCVSIGPQTAATLLGELGAFTRFTDARALVAYVGFYPVIQESGDRAATPRLSRVGSRIARRSLYLAAVNAVRGSGEWRTIYLRKKAQGKTAK